MKQTHKITHVSHKVQVHTLTNTNCVFLKAQTECTHTHTEADTLVIQTVGIMYTVIYTQPHTHTHTPVSSFDTPS